jgi:DNA polymerase I-like protein with 3'-5' exonuclease and polymerase domains
LVTGSVEEVAANLENSHLFSFDIETTGLNPIDSRTLLGQFGFPNGKNFVLDVRKSAFKELLPFLERRYNICIIHNAKFEQKFIQYEFNSFIYGVYDTMLAEQIITAQNYPTSLADVVFKYTGQVLDKTQQKSFVDMPAMEMFTPQQLEYAARDVEVLFPIYEKQIALLEESGQSMIAKIEFDLAGVVAAMELEGMPINTKKWRGKLEDYRIRHDESELKFLNIIFDGDIYSDQQGAFEPVLKEFNVGSPKQVAAALVGLGIDLPKTDKGNLKTDERTLQTIKHPATEVLLEYREYDKILSTYGETFIGHIHPFTNRIHPDFGQIGTETGRFSCKDPNVQNIPAEFRECIGDLKDHKIVGADYANIELRIIAELSDDEALIKAFNTGDDPHKSTAAIMFNIPIDTVTKEQRFIAKTINFGLTYGMGAPKLRDMLNEGKDKKDMLSMSKVFGIVNRYKETYSGVTRYFDQSGREAFNKGESVTMLGRKRYFNRPSGVDEETFKIQSAAIRRQGGNAPIQGTNADITKLAMVNLNDDLREYNFRAKIMAQVHDEIVVLAHKNHAEAVKEVVQESMLRSAQGVLTKVPVKVDTYISDIWAK